MVVAYLAADRAALQAIFSDPGKFYNADPYTFLFASLLVFVFGPGTFALDHLVTRHFSNSAANLASPHRAQGGRAETFPNIMNLKA
jgi:putative oxidoreductase